jgi:hypothetical protein
MPSQYQSGRYLFTPEQFTLATDFTARTATTVGPDEFSTVEEIDLEQGEGFRLGQGFSSNPLQAESSVRGDIQDGSDDDIDGRFRLVVLNEQNNVVDVLTQGTINEIEETRANSIDGHITTLDDREVYEPMKVGLQLKTNSGTSTYDSGNSSLTIDGYRGETLR